MKRYETKENQDQSVDDTYHIDLHVHYYGISVVALHVSIVDRRKRNSSRRI